MAYRLMAWDGDFRTRDMFSASGRVHHNFTTKKEATEAAKRFMSSHAPRSDEARVLLEKHSGSYGVESTRKWTRGSEGKWEEQR